LYYDTTSKQVFMPNANVSGTVYSATLTASGNLSAGNIEAVGGGLIKTSGDANVGNLNATYISGTLTTAAQPNVTSLGTLTGLTVNGTTDLSAIGNVKISGGTPGQIIQTDGAGNLSFATNDSSQIVNGTSNVSIPVADGNINMVRGGSTVVVVTGTGANVTGYVDVTGDINGNNITAGNIITASGIVDATTSDTGTIKTTGGIAAQGNIYTGHSVGFADNNGGTASKAYIQFNSTSNSLDFIFN
jgi:hypothetical protein